MEKRLPKLYSHMMRLDVSNAFWLTKWLLTLYVYTFPVKICVRICDYLFSTGVLALVNMIIPVMKRFEEQILRI